MKKIFLLLLLTSTLFVSAQTTDKRDVLFLSGIGNVSAPWDYFSVNARNSGGYKMNVIDPLNTPDYPMGLEPVANCATKVGVRLNNNANTNVLGIGHDGGGIVLRQMVKNGNTPLTALILDGVPNQGSNAIQKMLPSAGFNQSYVEELLANLDEIRSASNDCSLCGVINRFSDFASYVKNNPTSFQEFTPQNPAITTLGQPTIPYALIWGNADQDNFVVDRMLASFGFVADGTYADNLFKDCYLRRIKEKQAVINQAQTDALVYAVTGLQLAVLNVQGAITISNGTPTLDVSKISSAFSALRSDALKAIDKIRESNAALADLLECELIHQTLNASWNLIASGGYTIKSTVVTSMPNPDCCWSCDGEPVEFIDACYEACLNSAPCNQTITTTVYSYTYIPHDGLYSRDEQLLAGANKVYEAKQTNHFQEQAWFNNAIQAPFRDLMDGNAGLAFKVPK